MQSTNTRGAIAELRIAARLSKLGYTVSFPVGDDQYAVYCPETDACYFIPAGMVGSQLSLRVAAPRLAHPSIRFAKDYLRP